MKIVVIDYNAGNLASLLNSLKTVYLQSRKSVNIKVSNIPKEISNSDKIILPGVGDFSNCKKQLEKIDGMTDALYEHTRHLFKPFLGICIGMQLMAKSSEERGKHQGLGYFNAEVKKIENDKKHIIKIPHMGWNTVDIEDKKMIKTFTSLDKNDFYFVHSYQMVCKNNNDILASVNYGKKIVAAIIKDNMVGVQFHPEKSQKKGLEFLKEFIEWKP